MKDTDFRALGMAPPTRMHQFLVAEIISNYRLRFGRNILTDASIDDTDKRVPDISIWEKMSRKGRTLIAENPLLTIEITHTRRNDIYSEVSIRETFNLAPSLREAFIYNYETDSWTRYTREGDKVRVEDGKDYSRVLKCYLHTLLDE